MKFGQLLFFGGLVALANVGGGLLLTRPRISQKSRLFLGYLVGDGHISERKKVIGLTTGDEEQADHFSSLVDELFDLPTRKKLDSSGGATRWRVLFSSKNAEEFLKSLGLATGRCARRKCVPEIILRSPKPVVAAFLRAYFDCDGYAGKQGVILSTSCEIPPHSILAAWKC